MYHITRVNINNTPDFYNIISHVYASWYLNMKITLVKGCDPYVLGRLQAKFLKPIIMLYGED